MCLTVVSFQLRAIGTVIDDALVDLVSPYLMTYEPLHHKYRPQTFAELVGQAAIATTLTNAISSRRIAPAYLLTGPRGTGKTSSARILAKSLNCLSYKEPTPKPCGQCEVCRAIARGSALDVIEIDAASNTGVDNIREIIERAQFAPVQCRYKVYVIDECHMLSTAAFNALLKTLEEPPLQVVFVLATTDPQRVLPTIISRCQRFDYRRIPLQETVAHLAQIARKENINIDEDAIGLVAQIAKGGLRDAQSLLDQLSLLSGTITAQRVWDLVGAVPEQDLLALLKAIASGAPEAVLEQCRHLIDRGREPLVVLQNLANFYLNLLIAKTAPTRTDLVAVTEPTWKQLCAQAQRWELQTILHGQQRLKDSEAQLKSTTQPYLWLEITLLELLPSTPGQIQATAEDVPTEPLKPALGACVPGRIPVVPDKPEESKGGFGNPPLRHPFESRPQATNSSAPQPTARIPNDEPASVETPLPQPDELWQEMLNHLHPPTTQALLSQHCWLIRLDNSVARIGVKNKALLGIAQSKLTNIEAAFQAACDQPIKVNLQITTPESGPSDTVASPGEFTQEPERNSAPDAANPYSQTRERRQNSENLSNSFPDLTSPNSVASLESLSGELPQESVRPLENFAPSLLAQPSPQEYGGVANNQSTGSLSETAIDEREENDIDEQIEQAAQSLAHCFAGEIVTLGDYSNDETTVASSELNDSQESVASNQPMIRGRPDLTDFEDEDLPF